MSTGPIELERSNLEAHVDLCAQRYENIEKRLDAIEEKVGGLEGIIKDSHSSMVKVIIGTAGTVVAGVLSVLVVILSKMS
jgi:tetrahydromethanopterin S-methyltransferase subunit G